MSAFEALLIRSILPEAKILVGLTEDDIQPCDITCAFCNGNMWLHIYGMYLMQSSRCDRAAEVGTMSFLGQTAATAIRYVLRPIQHTIKFSVKIFVLNLTAVKHIIFLSVVPTVC